MKRSGRLDFRLPNLHLARELSAWRYPKGKERLESFDFGEYKLTVNLQGQALSIVD
jgi:hypothetical protein